MKFGEYLVAKGYIEPNKLTEALKIQSILPKKLGRLLKELGLIDNDQLNRALDGYLATPTSGLVLDGELKNDPEFEKAWGYRLIKVTPEHLIISGEAVKDEIFAQLESEYQKEVLFVGRGRQPFEGSQIYREKKIRLSAKSKPDDLLMADEPFTNFFRYSLETAKNKLASDLHFEPFFDRYTVRMRVLGGLERITEVEPRFGESLTTKIKEIVNMDIAQVASPQDSQATFTTLGIVVRASSVPVSSGGEKIVLRLIYPESTPSISQLGLEQEQEQFLRRVIQNENGLIVISGPTGSGKTTTLYSLLAEMDKEVKNISTLENPVEKTLPGINQLNVDEIGDFPKFQRALMRQDPDIILLGEIRDSETAKLGLKLANSGHLVLSTIHANGATEAIDRLIQLGVPRDSIEEMMRASIAQRLVKVLCDCSRVNSLEQEGSGCPIQSGCNRCNNGIKERKAIIEYLDYTASSDDRRSALRLSFPIEDQLVRLVNAGEISSDYINHLGGHR